MNQSKKLDWQRTLASSLFIFTVASAGQTSAQVTPDGTLGTRVNGSTSLPCNGSICTITGGTLDPTGKNLFHSFQDFSVLDVTGVARFNNATSVQNIISRVTGTSISTINGSLRANSTANVFLINPNGVVFGRNAQLNIQGSFLATTADALGFGTMGAFGISTGNQVALLTVNPSTLLFNQIAPSSITNQARLRVPNGRSLVLVGGDVTLEGGQLLAPTGRIELAGLAAPGTVGLQVDGNALRLIPVDGQTADIALSKKAVVDVSGQRGGTIQLQGRRVTLGDESRVSANTGDQNGGGITIQSSQLRIQEGSQVSASTTGAGRAGDIEIVSELVELIGTSADNRKPSKIADDSDEAAGNGGNLRITTNQLMIRDGARISASISGSGQAGNIDVNADAVELVGTSPGGRRPSGLSVQNRGEGIGGTLTITTHQLIVKDGAEVSAATYGKGAGGTVVVNADLIELVGVATSADDQRLPSTLLAQSGGREVLSDGPSPPATGDGGSLLIKTGQLIVRDGAAVTVSSEDFGNAGNLEIQAGSIQLNNQGKIQAETVSGAGGNITLRVQNSLQLNQGRISAQSRGTGKAGTTTIEADQILSTNNSQITTQAPQAGGGDIQITARDIRLRNSSPISSSVFDSDSQGNGGNITINSDVFIALEDSDILANAVRGKGGNIIINSPAFLADFFSRGSASAVEPNSGDFSQFRGNERVDISASSQVGISGNVTFVDFTFLASLLSELSSDLVNSDQVVADSCLAHRNSEQGSFILTGTGGIPPAPYDALSSRYSVVRIQSLRNSTAEATEESRISNPKSSAMGSASGIQNWQLGDPVQEAQGITVTAEGRIIAGTTPQLGDIADAQKLICYLPNRV